MRSIMFLAMLLAASCSLALDTDNLKPPDNTLSSGTYALSDVSVARDECAFSSIFIGSGEKLTSLDVVVDQKFVAIKFVITSGEQIPSVGIVDDNKVAAQASKDMDTIPGSNCADKWSKKWTGTLVANDSFTGIYEFSDTTISGSDCSNPNAIGFTAPSCTTIVKFTATKVKR